jgi:hypothetical protein
MSLNNAEDTSLRCTLFIMTTELCIFEHSALEESNSLLKFVSILFTAMLYYCQNKKYPI